MSLSPELKETLAVYYEKMGRPEDALAERESAELIKNIRYPLVANNPPSKTLSPHSFSCQLSLKLAAIAAIVILAGASFFSKTT